MAYYGLVEHGRLGAHQIAGAWRAAAAISRARLGHPSHPVLAALPGRNLAFRFSPKVPAVFACGFWGSSCVWSAFTDAARCGGREADSGREP